MTKEINYFKCAKCTWVHFKSKEPSLLPEGKCFCCGHDLFVEAKESDVPAGSTIQPVYKPRIKV